MPILPNVIATNDRSLLVFWNIK